MEGPLLIIKSWALVALLIWVHRRYFERVARAEPSFEAWCQSAPLVAALHGDPEQLEQLERALAERLGKRRRVVATLGGWPWPNYALEIRLAREGRVLRLTALSADLLRTHGTPPPCLVEVLRGLSNDYPGSVSDMWLLPETIYGKAGPSAAPSGWMVRPGHEPRPRVVARDASPDWLVPATRDVAAEAAQ